MPGMLPMPPSALPRFDSASTRNVAERDDRLARREPAEDLDAIVVRRAERHFARRELAVRLTDEDDAPLAGGEHRRRAAP